jgi:hypothetical protein
MLSWMIEVLSTWSMLWPLLIMFLVGMIVLYLFTRWKKMGKFLGFIKFLLIFALIVPCFAEDIIDPGTPLNSVPDKPVIINPIEIKKAGDQLLGYLGFQRASEEEVWRSEMYLFLNNESEGLIIYNKTINNSSIIMVG